MALLSPKTPSFLIFFFILCTLLLPSSSVFANTQKCIKEHFSALLHLKHGFVFSYAGTNLSSWNSNNTDCCFWEGITCDGPTGHVIGLDLSGLRISGRIDSESLFRLRSLRELYLDHVNISAQGSEWGRTLFLSLPLLRVLSLQYCGLSGPIHSSLSQLRFLYELDLSYNNLSGSLPSFLVNLSKLEYLYLSFNSFSGPIPSSYGNQLLNLKEIVLWSNLLNGTIPSSLFSLPSLQYLDLEGNKLSGRLDIIHNASCTQLEVIYLTRNNFQGMVPSFLFQLTKLQKLYVSSNNFSGVVINNATSTQLEEVHLDDNNFQGMVPSFIFKLMKLRIISLSFNNFSGVVIHNASSTQLEEVYLDHNNFQGTVPSFIFKLTKLRTISLSLNNFSGVVEIGSFQTLKNLSSLYLSDNNLSIEDSGGNSTFASFPQIRWLSLRSCNITKFPNFLRNQEQMVELDLSNNRITGEIPKWIWKVGNGSLISLNISHNALQTIEQPFPHDSLSDLLFLDLSSNVLEGSVPIPPPSSIFFSLSSNTLRGEIPMSICNTTSLGVLDLSQNQLSGGIPWCIGEISDALNVLNLRGNMFNGTLLQTFKKGCKLRTLDLSENQLEGQVPKSLANCKMLEVLNLGKNQIYDTFPSWVETLSQLHVLVLKSNKFYGPITLPQTNQSFPMLQIIDLSSNSFMGGLPSNMFRSWKAMAEEDQSQSKFLYRITISIRNTTYGAYYQDTVMVTTKGMERELTKILTIFTTVDLSNNSFQGDIPESIGILKSLRLLNMSCNSFTGQIPKSLENLTVLEALDLSQNNFSGRIPWQLTKLTFLSMLNLSHNHLVGSIPQIKQFSTFTNESFKGNLGLCGPPLSRKCVAPPSVMPTFEDATSELDWAFMWIGFEVGYGAGMGVFFWTLTLWTKGRKVYNKFIDGLGLVRQR